MKIKPGLSLLLVLLFCLWTPAPAYSDEESPQDDNNRPAGSSRTGITPLETPDTLVIPADETEVEFDDFVFDDGPSESFVEINSRNLYEYHHISGPGKEASFLEQGGHAMSDLELRTRKPFGDSWRTEFNSTVRFTQSRRYDPKDFSVQYLQMIIADDTNTNHVTLGDYYASLSQYTLNRGIKGIGYQRAFSEHSYIRLVGGSFHSRWDYVVNREEDEPVDRSAVGLRAQVGQDSFLVGLNLVSAWDRDDDPSRTTQTTYKQTLPSLDWEYRNSVLRLTGEHAYAPTRKQEVLDSGDNRERKNITGTANRINANATLGKLRLQARTEHVTPDFYTMGGGAAVDRFRIFTRGDYRINRTWSLYAGNDWYRNNLESQLDATTTTTVPEIGLRAQGLFGRRSLDFSSGLRRRIVKTESPMSRENITDRINFGLGDRFGDVSVRGEVEVLLNEDKKSDPKSKREDYLYRLVIDSRHMIMDGKLDLRPYLTLEHQEVEDPGTGKPVRTDAARFDLRVLTMNDLSFGLNLEGRTTKSSIDDRDNTYETRYAFNIEKRPEFLGGGMMRAEIGHNRYKFTDGDRNYRENFVLFSIDLTLSRGN